MATTSPDGIVSPDSDQPVDWVGDWAATASSVQTALSNRSTKMGTTIQRNAATGVREGTLWYDTTTGSVYRRSTGTWSEITGSNTLEVINLSSHTVSGVSGVITARIYGRITNLFFDLTANTNFGATTSMTTVANIPAGRARPAGAAYSGALFTTPGSGFGSGTARINPNGSVAVNPPRATETTASFGFTFINGG